MKKNIGSPDRILRALFAVVVAVLFLTNQISGVAAVILGILAVVFLVTSFAAVCPIYLGLKMSTMKKEKPTAGSV